MAKYRNKQKSILGGSGSGAKGLLRWTDWPTLLLCLACSIFGLVMVHSATHRAAELAGRTFSTEVVTMALAIVVGIVAAVVMSFIDYEILLRFWWVIAIICVLLMLLLLTPLGWAPDFRPDATRWIRLTPDSPFTFQPSELLRLGFIISFTWHIHRVRDNINQIKNIALLGAHAMVPFGLVVITGDLGSALVLLFVTIGMLFLAGLKLRWFAAIIAMAAAAAPLIWFQFISTFQRNRILALYFPDSLPPEIVARDMYQQNQAMIAIGSGQLTGRGLFNSATFVPLQEHDMIFSLIGEELGFIGAVLAVALLAAVIIRLVLVSSRTRNLRARLLCSGVAFMIGAQAIINIGVTLRLLPVTGITLPFFSAGGSANLTIFLLIGLVLTVFRFQNEHEDTQAYFDYLYN
ncbi:MAG: FtsW/RodA/SpoVE family cell cycle protein [Oscillospiraceae bacterium]|nr:FtsW/RodA/SpoVE family cell cycle protein [Oscillospiraceae bacterium]